MNGNIHPGDGDVKDSFTIECEIWWSMPRKVFDDNNISRGKNFRKVCEFLFPKISREKIGALLGGVPGTTIHSWENGKSIANRALLELHRRGVSLEWLLSSEGEMFTAGRDLANPVVNQVRKQECLPPTNAQRLRDYDMHEGETRWFRVVGEAAAFEGGGKPPGAFGEDDRTIWDDVEIPGTTHFVRVTGDSMSPVFLHGQYAMVGPEYQYGAVPCHREIVVVEVVIRDDEQAGSDAPWEGVYCKRAIDAESSWFFESINPAYDTFSIAKSNCRLWPVIGVYFAGKGKPPEE